MKKILLLILILLQSSFAGRYGDAFIQTSLPAHASAMGNTAVTQLRGLSSIISNPAGLAQERQNSLLLQYSDVFGLASQSSMAFHYAGLGKYHLGVSWFNVNVGGIAMRPDILDSLSFIERRNFLRQRGFDAWETFSNREDAVYITLARSFTHNVKIGWAYDEFNIINPVGLSIKMLNKSVLEESGRGVGIDFGTKFIIPGREIFYIRKLGDFVLGLNVENVYTTGIYWTTRHVDQVWMTFRGGIALHQPLEIIRSEMWLIWEQKALFDSETNRYGIDFRMADRVSIRIGRDFYNWNGGIGLRLTLAGRDLVFDYAYQAHPLDDAHRMTFTIFPEKKK
jgi:hypothetical protein